MTNTADSIKDISGIPTNTPSWSHRRLGGINYKNLLREAHRYLRPKLYLEIGVNTGATLALSTCTSIAVDPFFLISENVMSNKPSCHFYNMTSDDFFRSENISDLIDESVDMAFLDGLHLFEFLLRDFMNTEKLCRRNSVIFMHDCIPTDLHLARRDMNDVRLAHLTDQPAAWAGDVWKAVAILKELRPDLCIRAFDAEPTGLIAITNLDPQSDTIEREYFNAVSKYSGSTLVTMGESYMKELKIIDYSTELGFNNFSELFSL